MRIDRLVSTWALASYCRAKDVSEAEGFVDEIRLLTRTEFESLFPDAVIVRERFFGLTKSFIAVRG